jgi:hypothetical protein
VAGGLKAARSKAAKQKERLKTLPAHWRYREELSRQNKLRRSIYEVLRDQLDEYMITHGLIRSYSNFVDSGQDYPFVEKRELKPRARIPQQEYDAQNSFLVIFLEDTIAPMHKKYLRFFDSNRTTKKNLLNTSTIHLSESLERSTRSLEDVRFIDFMEELMQVDYALLIQRDPSTKARNRYQLTHFHVRVDWPIADAAEDLGRYLRYISKDLYERGDEYAENLQKKFFEYYGMPVMSGGRRTAAIVAAQYLRRLPSISTIYVGSSESRTLFRISERDVSKSIVMLLDKKEMTAIADAHEMGLATFQKNYLFSRAKNSGAAIFRATYTRTSQGRSPEDSKIRELNQDLNWLSVEAQHLLPKPGVTKFRPLPYNVIYS